MPQMAPLSWLTLFFLFSMFIMAINNKIWFSAPTSTYHNEMESSNKSTLSMSNPYTWKW